MRPISHALIARTALPLDQITTVVSHPQALAQCADFLRAELPWATAMAWTSTAEAVLETAARPEPWAAIGTPRAAELYGCVVLREGIEGRAGNETRFVWIAPATAPAPFAPAGTTPPQDLARLLRRRRGRLRVARAVPLGVRVPRRQPDEDRVAAAARTASASTSSSSTSRAATGDERVRAAIDGLRAHCDEVRVLGSYPAA